MVLSAVRNATSQSPSRIRMEWVFQCRSLYLSQSIRNVSFAEARRLVFHILHVLCHCLCQLLEQFEITESSYHQPKHVPTHRNTHTLTRNLYQHHKHYSPSTLMVHDYCLVLDFHYVSTLTYHTRVV